MGRDYYDEYYDQIFVKGRKYSIDEIRRSKATISLIPKDISSLLEVGCGEGRIINPLQNKYEKVFGMDISDEALKHVETPKIKGRIENIPFPDNSFDIVLCCEVLEHLPSPIYEKALQEIQRVAKKYILISVPNNEDILIGRVRCPRCGSLFHVNGHLRSFNLSTMENLFDIGKLLKYETVSIDVFWFHETVIQVKKWFKQDFFTFEDAGFCPKCGFTHPSDLNKVKSPYFLERLPFRFPTKKSGGWIIALYDKDFYEMQNR